MDTGGFSTAHLAVGLLSRLDYHCGRCRRILLRTFSTSEELKIKELKRIATLITNHLSLITNHGFLTVILYIL